MPQVPATIRRCLTFFHPADRVLIALIVCYIAASWGVAALTGHGAAFAPLIYLGTGAQMSVTFLLGYVLYRLARMLWIMIAHRPGNLKNALWEDLKKGPLDPALYRRGLPVLIAFVFFFSAFTSMKFLIAQINPFLWDEFFMTADRALHFGHDPWRLLMPVFGSAEMTKLTALVYICWLPLFFLVLYWQLFRLKDDPLRMQFFYSFVLCWAINGTLLAIVFSSAGPCFYEYVTGSVHFKPLMDHLYGIHNITEIYALPTQEKLWQNYSEQGGMLGGGISAFPSVHVGTALLFVLLGRRTNRFAYATFLVFFAFILTGSVYLGWHYAVDGYFAILTTAGIWWFSGKMAGRLSLKHPKTQKS